MNPHIKVLVTKLQGTKKKFIINFPCPRWISTLIMVYFTCTLWAENISSLNSSSES